MLMQQLIGVAKDDEYYIASGFTIKCLCAITNNVMWNSGEALKNRFPANECLWDQRTGSIYNSMFLDLFIVVGFRVNLEANITMYSPCLSGAILTPAIHTLVFPQTLTPPPVPMLKSQSPQSLQQIFVSWHASTSNLKYSENRFLQCYLDASIFLHTDSITYLAQKS